MRENKAGFSQERYAYGSDFIKISNEDKFIISPGKFGKVIYRKEHFVKTLNGENTKIICLEI